MAKAQCSQEDCERPVLCRGVCQRHYHRLRVAGLLGDLPRADVESQHRLTSIDATAKTATCSICGQVRVRVRTRRSYVEAECYTLVREGKRGRNRRSRARLTPQQRMAAQLRFRYQMTLAQYDELLEQQGGGCKICSAPPRSGRRLSVDHDHACCPGPRSCGECIRGLLCHRCNLMLGSMADSQKHLLRAAEYLTAG